jgi:Tol biopolymer transport system component/DNA-binding winged helix-turn-helix (wHTH) protein
MVDFASKRGKVSSSSFSIISQQNLTAPKFQKDKVYEFEDFRLEVEHLMLYKNGEAILLKPKVVETLLALVERRGEIVSKDTLMKRLWADTAVEEGNLTQNIYLLRKTLGNAANGKPLIETFWRRGYRFNGKVCNASEQVGSDAGLESGDQLSTALGPLGRWSAAAFAVSVLLFLGGLAIKGYLNPNWPDAKAGASASRLKITRLTPDLNVLESIFLPDGNHLAYVLVEKTKQSVWLKNLSSGDATQILPPTEEGYLGLNVSHDGKTLYYASHRKDAPNGTIYSVHFAGGEPQKIAGDAINPFAVSPDERQIAYINAKGQLVLVQTQGGDQRVLAERDGRSAWFASWGSRMSWAADGERLALCTFERDAQGTARPRLIEISIRDGVERTIAAPDLNYMEDAVWLPDSSSLLVVGRETETSPFQIWRVTNPGGELTRVTNDTNSYDDIALSSDGRQIAAQQQFDNMNLWIASLAAADQPKQITFGNAAEDGRNGIVFKPDGKIIYTSPRDGNIDLWEMDGNGQKQLTKNSGNYNGWPDVSSDGRFIVFTSSRSGENQIWRMDVDGGNARQLTNGGSPAIQPALSRDGNWVFFKFEDSIWKVSINGGQAERFSQPSNVWSPSVSPDGTYVAYQFYDERSAQPWKVGIMSAETGISLKTFDVFCFRHLTGWTADSKSLIYISGDQTNLRRLPIDGDKPAQITNFENGQINYFAVSTDYKRLALSRGNPSREVVLLDNFQ